MNVKDSLLGRSTEGRNLKHFNVSVSLFHEHLDVHTHTHTHTHTLSPPPPSTDTLLLPLLLSVKLQTFMSTLVIWFASQIHPSPLQCAVERHPPFLPPSLHPSPPPPNLHMEAAPVTLLADIWKCLGRALEVTVWTNRARTSTFAMWQAFIYLPRPRVLYGNTPRCRTSSPFTHKSFTSPVAPLQPPLISCSNPNHHVLKLSVSFVSSLSVCTRLFRRLGSWRRRRSSRQQQAPLRPDHLGPAPSRDPRSKNSELIPVIPERLTGRMSAAPSLCCYCAKQTNMNLLQCVI